MYLHRLNLASSIFKRIDRILFTIGGINPYQEMSLLQHMAALITITGTWLLLCVFVLVNMDWMPFNPYHYAGMDIGKALTTLKHYTTTIPTGNGKASLSYLASAMLILSKFITLACTIAISIVVVKAIKKEKGQALGNFYNYFVYSATRIVFPIALLSLL